MNLTNNVLRRELERIARAAACTDDGPKRLGHAEQAIWQPRW